MSALLTPHERRLFVGQYDAVRKLPSEIGVCTALFCPKFYSYVQGTE
jgi:hypothetical protein